MSGKEWCGAQISATKIAEAQNFVTNFYRPFCRKSFGDILLYIPRNRGIWYDYARLSLMESEEKP